MEASAGVGSAVGDLSEESTCCICLDFFRDPVSIACGHNFCRACLARYWGESEGEEASCPQCRAMVPRGNVIPNRPLASFVEITKKIRAREAGGEAAGKGGGAAACEKHREPLKLFCQDDKAPICVVCDRAKEHRGHQVVPLEEADQEYKDQICRSLENLREDRQKFQASKVVTEKDSQDLLRETEAERAKVVSKFRELHEFLADQEKLLLAQIEEVQKAIVIKRDEGLDRLSREISSLDSLMQEMEEKRRQPASEFLQDIGMTLKKTEMREVFVSDNFIDPAMMWKTSKIRDINPFLEVVLKKLKDLFAERQNILGNTERLQAQNTGNMFQSPFGFGGNLGNSERLQAQNTSNIFRPTTAYGGFPFDSVQRILWLTGDEEM